MKNISFETVCKGLFISGCVFVIFLSCAVVLSIGALVVTEFCSVDNPRGTVVFDPDGNQTTARLTLHKREYTVVHYNSFQPDPEELNVFVGGRRIATVSFQRSKFSDLESKKLFAVAREGLQRFLQERQKLVRAHYQPDQLAKSVANVLVSPGHINQYSFGSQNMYWWYQSQLDSVVHSTGLTPFIVDLDYDGIWDLNATESQKCPNGS